MKISALEQTLVCENNNINAIHAVKEILNDRSIDFDDKLRIVVLYSLRYETIPGNEIQGMKYLLESFASDQSQFQKLNVSQLCYTAFF